MSDGSDRPRVAFGEMPEHFCSACTSVRFDREPSCAECGASRPTQGWRRLQACDDALLGRTVDRRFFLSRRLGFYGAASLYRATSLTTPRDFALWVFSLGSEARTRRSICAELRQRARRIGELDSTSPVAIHEYLELSEDRLAVLLDSVGSASLADHLERHGPMGIGRASRLGVELLRGVLATRNSGGVGLQLGPDRIFLHRHGDDDSLRLLPAPLPGLADDAARPATAKDYLSPEQRRGAYAGAASDVFCAGALLFSMLTGHPPRARWAGGDGWGMRVDRNALAASEVRPDGTIPEPLDGLVAAMMNRDPDRRPTDIAKMIELLERHAQPDTTSANERDATSSPGVSVTQTGNCFAVSERTSVIERDRPYSTPPPPRPELSVSETLDRRIAAENLPDDLDPKNSISFWSDPATNTGSFGWINRPMTDDLGGRDSEQPFEPLAHTSCLHGRRLTAVDTDNILWRIDPRESNEAERLAELPAPAHAVAAVGETTYVGLEDGRLLAVALPAGSSALLETVDRAAIVALAVDGAGKRIVAAAQTGRIYIAALQDELSDADWSRVRTKEAVSDVAVSAKARYFAVLRQSGQVEIRSLEPRHEAQSTFQSSESADAIALSDDGQLLAICGAHSTRLLRAHSGQIISRFDRLSHQPASLWFDAHNDLIGVCQDEAGVVLLWDLAANAPVKLDYQRQRG